MQNNVELLTPLDSFEGDNGISWKLMNIKMKMGKITKAQGGAVRKIKIGNSKIHKAR